MKENLKKCTSFEERKGTRYVRGKVYFVIVLYTKVYFVYKTISQISFNLFCSGDIRLLSEFLRKWGWFQGQNESFLKYLGQKLEFQNTETQFCRWRSTDNNDINIFLSLKNPCTFLLAKEKTWKCILALIVNYRKIVQKNKLCHPKQQ